MSNFPPTKNNRTFLDALSNSDVWPFDLALYLRSFTIQAELDLIIRGIILGQATTMQPLKIMQDALSRVIACQRQIRESKPFVGRVLFYMCLAAPVIAAGALWIRHRAPNRSTQAVGRSE